MCLLDVEHEAAEMQILPSDHPNDSDNESADLDTSLDVPESSREAAATPLPLSISAPPKKNRSIKPNMTKVDPIRVTMPPKKKKSQKPTVNKRKMDVMLVTVPLKKKSVNLQAPSAMQLAHAPKPAPEPSPEPVPEPSPTDVTLTRTLTTEIMYAPDAEPPAGDQSLSPDYAEAVFTSNDVANDDTAVNSSQDTSSADTAKVLAVDTTNPHPSDKNGGKSEPPQRKTIDKKANPQNERTSKGKRNTSRASVKGKRASASAFSKNQRGRPGGRRKSNFTPEQSAAMVKAMAMEHVQGRKSGAGYGITASQYKTLMNGPLAVAMGLKKPKKKKRRVKKRRQSKSSQRKQAARMAAGKVTTRGLKAKAKMRKKAETATERTTEELETLKDNQVE